MVKNVNTLKRRWEGTFDPLIISEAGMFTFSCEYLREFSKKFETPLMVYSGDWGKLIHEKNQKSKIS
jgi:hypothetical protein